MADTRRDLTEELAARLEAATRAADAWAARAGETSDEARRLRRRARLLRGFVRNARAPGDLPLRCAWCGRVEVAGEFVAPEDFLDGDLPDRLRLRATHGICPECLERELARR